MTRLRAVLYIRVSSDEQVKGTSLETQLEAGIQYNKLNSIDLVKIFREEGESAKTADRAELQRALQFATDKKNKVDLFEFYDYSRFSRNLEDHISVKSILSKYGVRIKSIVQNVDDKTATGRFIENILVATGQFQNEFDTEKKMNGIRDRLSNGMWPYNSPLGYRKIKHPDGRLQEVPNEANFKVLKQCINDILYKGYSIKDCETCLKNNNIRTNRGAKITYKYLHGQFFPNIFNAGIVKSEKYGIMKQGTHEPMCTLSEYYMLQDLLYAKKKKRTIKKEREDFPLRNTLLCSHCRNTMTSSYSKNALGKLYGYYHCSSEKCQDKQRLSISTAHTQLLEILADITPHADLLNIVKKKIFLKLDAKYQDLEISLLNQKNEESKLRKKLERIKEGFEEGVYSKEEYFERTRKVEIELAFMEESRIKLDKSVGEIKSEIDNALINIEHLQLLWNDASIKGKRILATWLFPEGIECAKSGLRTPSINPLFKLIDTVVDTEISSSGAEKIILELSSFIKLLPNFNLNFNGRVL